MHRDLRRRNQRVASREARHRRVRAHRVEELDVLKSAAAVARAVRLRHDLREKVIRLEKGDVQIEAVGELNGDAPARWLLAWKRSHRRPRRARGWRVVVASAPRRHGRRFAFRIFRQLRLLCIVVLHSAQRPRRRLRWEERSRTLRHARALLCEARRLGNPPIVHAADH